MSRAGVLIAALCAVHTDAYAQATNADALAAEAEKLAADGQFPEAAAKFREAYAAEPRVAFMCNVGVAYHKAKDLPRAQLFLSHCLKRGTALEAEFVAAVRGVLAIVEGALKSGDFTPVDIVVEPEATSVTISTFGSDASAIGPHLVWLPFGTHRLTFRAEGYIEQTLEIATANRDTLPISVKLEKKPAPAPVIIEKPVRIERSARSIYPAIGASAATLGAVIYAAVAFTRAHERADIASRAISEDVYAADKEYVDKWNTRLAVSGAVAIVGAAASGFLWYRALTPATKVEITPTTSGATVTFRTRF